MDLVLNNLQGLICHKTQQTKANQTILTKIKRLPSQEKPEKTSIGQYHGNNENIRK